MSTSNYHAGGVTFPHSPIMIGAGACKTPSQTEKWLRVAPVVSGSYTPEAREGNRGKVFFPETLEDFLKMGFGLNALSMPNMGFVEAAQEFSLMKVKSPLIISIAGFSIDDYLNGILALKDLHAVVSAIEWNFGCPNTEHGNSMSSNLRLLDELFRKLLVFESPFPIWVKFSPYSDTGLLKEVASVVNSSKSVIRAVVTCNTFPNAFAGRENISPNNGLAGLSGPVIKHIGLGQVVQFRQHLDPEVDVIGVGGITTGNDVVDFLTAGARAVQLTSMPFWSGNPGEFWERLLNTRDGARLEEYLTNNA